MLDLMQQHEGERSFSLKKEKYKEGNLFLLEKSSYVGLNNTTQNLVNTLFTKYSIQLNRITGLQNGQHWKGSLKVILSNCPAQQCHLYSLLTRTMFRWILNISKDEFAINILPYLSGKSVPVLSHPHS